MNCYVRVSRLNAFKFCVTIAELSFNQPQYRASVSEKEEPGTVVIRVQASSFPPGQHISYAIISENLIKPTKFTIDANTGKVILTGELDREVTSNYLLDIEASSQVSNGSGATNYRTTKGYIVINVLDQNDNAPFFTHASYYVHIPCNTSVGKTVYRVRAQDKDNGYNARLRYKLQSKIAHFSILPNSGKIKVNKDLRQFCDSLPLRSFKMSVLARDRGIVPLSAHANIHIIVTPPGQLSRQIINENLWTSKNMNKQRVQTAGKTMSRPRGPAQPADMWRESQ